MLTGDPDERVRYDALIALGKVGDMRGVDVLIAALIGPDDDAACSGLSEMGPQVVPRVRELLASDDEGVLCCAISVLADVARSQALPWIKPFLDHQSERVRLIAADEIEEIAINPSLSTV